MLTIGGPRLVLARAVFWPVRAALPLSSLASLDDTAQIHALYARTTIASDIRLPVGVSCSKLGKTPETLANRIDREPHLNQQQVIDI